MGGSQRRACERLPASTRRALERAAFLRHGAIFSHDEIQQLQGGVPRISGAGPAPLHGDRRRLCAGSLASLSSHHEKGRPNQDRTDRGSCCSRVQSLYSFTTFAQIAGTSSQRLLNLLGLQTCRQSGEVMSSSQTHVFKLINVKCTRLQRKSLTLRCPCSLSPRVVHGQSNGSR